MGYLYVALTLVLTVYGQLVMKWQISKVGPMPVPTTAKLLFLLSQFLNPWILSGLFAAFLASMCWMAAMTMFELGQVYPFMSLTFVIVMLLSAVLFGESLSLGKIFGILLVCSGLVVLTR